ncbi:phosphoadenosine phosphosulfate reductase family protein (plasmid) [Paenibacillus sp. EC2-1]|uniref:phosphoadenosine phosphosulfate reductase domain-containing protein n=1 Tax=Paenibacillus sp. EC2-1 TaxID=3388665 RepID=UPI003BEF1239
MTACNNYEGGERYYIFQKPRGYKASKSMPEKSCSEWICKISHAAAEGRIRQDLADKVVQSLERMPDLPNGRTASVSFSGGKDSIAIFILARMRYSKDQIISLFCDTGDEWPETYQTVDEFQDWVGVPVERLTSMGIHTLLREIIPVWPKKGVRHCTKNLKMVPQRDWFDSNGYGQVRYRGKVSFRTGETYQVLHEDPLTFAGERWYESSNRAKLPFDSRDETMLRWTHRPVLDWRIEDIWDFIFFMRSPYNPIYEMGVNRAACAGCIFANTEELYMLGEYHPHLLEEWVTTEAAIGVPYPGRKETFEVIYEKLRIEKRLGCRQFFEWDGDNLKEVPA